MTRLAYRVLGNPVHLGILIVADHASNAVPADVTLGIDQCRLKDHIAWDIGVEPVACSMVQANGHAAILGNYSRLVVDLNRNRDEDGVVPACSDGLIIPGNDITGPGRESRIRKYYDPYHDKLAKILTDSRPSLILSLHSFTPRLETRKQEARPWEIGVLYNEQDTPSRIAIGYLAGRNVQVGDQLPYSGKVLNATMNRHAEANQIPYIGIEMRQDLVSHKAGQERFTQILTDMCHFVSEKLGLAVQKQ
ncbi:MAG: N-formylglutamate amidohydrolase [Sphingorhabdus sp.]